MKKRTHTFTSKIWLWTGDAPAAWHFMTLPKDVSEQIKTQVTVVGKDGKKTVRRGFGSVKVIAKIGKTSWPTSLFPESRSGCYMLSIKLAVRKAEGLYMDGVATV